MSTAKLFDVKHQLIFYGKYHSNKYNVLIHICCVPLILWTTLILLSGVPVPSFFPMETIDVFKPFLAFKWSWAAIFAGVYALYYLALEPIAAILYLPLLSSMVLSAGPILATTWGTKMAVWLMVFSWVAQFAGHGLAEKRAPALLDNLVGAVVLAPFFVHLEVLFALGYRPDFHKEIVNGVGIEIAKFRKGQGDARRAKAL